jgi:amino acid transporter
MASIIIINLTACSIAILATASRQLWSFARNKGVPFSHFLAPTVLPNDIPTSALFVSLIIAVLLPFINIGSSAALNAIFAITTGSLLTSYMITIGSLISWRPSRKPLPVARFTLGRWGLSVNIAAMCFLMPVFIFSFFPTVNHPTAKTMNWAIAIYGGVLIFATFYYIVWARHSYCPPTDEVKRVLISQESPYASSEPADQMLELEQERVHVRAEKQL